MSYDSATRSPGVFAHHDNDCPARFGRPCTCGPLGYRGEVDDPGRSEPLLGPVVASPDAARAWIDEHQVAMESWRVATSDGGTVGGVVADFLEAARAGRTVDSNGEPYDADALERLRWSLQGHVAGELGSMRIADVHGAELRRLVQRLDASGLSAERTRAVVDAVRALLRYAAQQGLVAWGAADTLILREDDSRPMRATGPVAVAAYGQNGATGPSGPLPAARTPAMIPDEVLWMVVKIVVVVFALIALVLVAESV